MFFFYFIVLLNNDTQNPKKQIIILQNCASSKITMSCSLYKIQKEKEINKKHQSFHVSEEGRWNVKRTNIQSIWKKIFYKNNTTASIKLKKQV